MNNAKNLGGSTQQSIKNLRARKKDTADKFQQQKLKIEAEYLRSTGETDRLQASYQVALKEAGKLKEKLDDLYKKNKSLYHFTFHLMITIVFVNFHIIHKLIHICMHFISLIRRLISTSYRSA